MSKEQTTNEQTRRVMLVLDREARRAAEAAERVRLVVHAHALRLGVSESSSAQELREPIRE
jgi:type II secretory pathway component PulJ